MDFGPLILSVILGVLVTESFKAIRSEWPRRYVDFTSIVDPIQQRSLFRWVLFRAIPVLLFSSFLFATLENWETSLMGPTLVFVLYHLLSLYLYPFVSGLRNHNLTLSQVILWIMSIFVVVVTTSISLVSRNVLAPLVPTPSEMIQVLWTGVAAAMGLAIITRVINRDGGVMTHELISNSILEVEKRFESKIAREAALYCSDFALLKAIAVTENIQRPAWLRRIENLTACFRKVGTYGLMQVKSSHSLSNEESITISARDFFANTAQVHPENQYDTVLRLTELVKKHNTNPVFLEMFENVLTELVH